MNRNIWITWNTEYEKVKRDFIKEKVEFMKENLSVTQKDLMVDKGTLFYRGVPWLDYLATEWENHVEEIGLDKR